jgi:hypothetical protein
MIKIFEPDKYLNGKQFVEETYKTINNEAERIKKARKVFEKSNE